jgi:hypothetical protein
LLRTASGLDALVLLGATSRATPLATKKNKTATPTDPKPVGVAVALRLPD